MLFLCEDNGIGISVATPRGWIEETFSTQPTSRYFRRRRRDRRGLRRAAARSSIAARAAQPDVPALARRCACGATRDDVETGYHTREQIERPVKPATRCCATRRRAAGDRRGDADGLRRSGATRARNAAARETKPAHGRS
jgi:hypothetical protein